MKEKTWKRDPDDGVSSQILEEFHSNTGICPLSERSSITKGTVAFIAMIFLFVIVLGVIGKAFSASSIDIGSTVFLTLVIIALSAMILHHLWRQIQTAKQKLIEFWELVDNLRPDPGVTLTRFSAVERITHLEVELRRLEALNAYLDAYSNQIFALSETEIIQKRNSAALLRNRARVSAKYFGIEMTDEELADAVEHRLPPQEHSPTQS